MTEIQQPEVVPTAATPQARAAQVQEFRAGHSTGKSLIGKPIIALDNGSVQGKTHDVVYSAGEGRLIGFTMLKGASFFSKGDAWWLPAEDIHALGEDAVTVKSASHLVDVEGDVNDYAAQAGASVLGKRLMTEDGKFLGAIDDVLVDRKSLRVVAYAVSGGVWHDMTHGQTDVPVSTITSIGEDVVIVPAFLQSEIDVAKGGLIATAAAAQVKATALGQEASAGIAAARTQAASAIERKEIEYALGKQAGRDVTDTTGLPLVVQGQTITQDVVDRAVAAGQMHGVALSAGYDQAGDALSTTKAKAGNLADAAKVKLAQADTAIQDKHGDLLVGKTTGRAVLSDSGLILVPANQVITPSDVLAARTAGKLDDLTLAVGVAVVDAGKEHAAAAYDTVREHAATAYDTTKAQAASAVDAAQARLAAAQAAPVVTSVPAATVPTAAPAAPATIIIEHPENVTVQNPGTVFKPEASSESDLQRS